MLEMVRKYGDEAKRKGVCIVHSCGFDSIPSDLTAFMLVDFIKQQLKGYGSELAQYLCSVLDCFDVCSTMCNTYVVWQMVLIWSQKCQRTLDHADC
jgi:short subunit dehydrogenase-like uncharacterized protein